MVQPGHFCRTYLGALLACLLQLPLHGLHAVRVKVFRRPLGSLVSRQFGQKKPLVAQSDINLPIEIENGCWKLPCVVGRVSLQDDQRLSSGIVVRHNVCKPGRCWVCDQLLLPQKLIGRHENLAACQKTAGFWCWAGISFSLLRCASVAPRVKEAQPHAKEPWRPLVAQLQEDLCSSFFLCQSFYFLPSGAVIWPIEVAYSQIRWRSMSPKPSSSCESTILREC